MLCHVERRFEILNNQKTFVPLGHFYSPIPDYEEIKNNEERIFSAGPRTMSGIDLREHEQFELLQNFQQYYNKQPFSLPPSNLRYFIGNSCYSHSDAIFLLSMICDLKPQRIIEVGSGFSSCAILDINELYFHNKIECTFIEPYPDRFLTLIRKDDSVRNTIIIQRLQDIPIAAFKALVKNDILFIDSTHVVKTFSDVHYLFSTILPNLNVGVHIHFHDIFYPFEYPKAWVYEGRGWNEAYFLRAFLQFNNCFEVTFFSTFLIHYYEDWFKQHMPLCIKDKGGGSLWIKKVGR
ncbi:MAG: class I SAM-dependent methyltransferase [Candidatus Omnitrophica bacterium]|nr:class I SAM-dependent methyltransferase [Candidatus Omnitrophota bacterium]